MTTEALTLTPSEIQSAFCAAGWSFVQRDTAVPLASWKKRNAAGELCEVDFTGPEEEIAASMLLLNPAYDPEQLAADMEIGLTPTPVAAPVELLRVDDPALFALASESISIGDGYLNKDKIKKPVAYAGKHWIGVGGSSGGGSIGSATLVRVVPTGEPYARTDEAHYCAAGFRFGAYRGQRVKQGKVEWELTGQFMKVRNVPAAPPVPTVEPAPDVLSTDEATDLRELEGVIERGQRTFVEVGKALTSIRDERLYRATHPSFEAYLAERWPEIGKRRAYQLIDAAEVAAHVNHGSLTRERQARPLAGLTPDQQRAAFDAAAQTAGNKPPTGAQVAQAAAAYKVPSDYYDYIARALTLGIDVREQDGEYTIRHNGESKATSQWAMVKSYIDMAKAGIDTRPLMTTPDAPTGAASVVSTREGDPAWLETARRAQRQLSIRPLNAASSTDRYELMGIALDLIAALLVAGEGDMARVTTAIDGRMAALSPKEVAPAAPPASPAIPATLTARASALGITIGADLALDWGGDPDDAGISCADIPALQRALDSQALEITSALLVGGLHTVPNVVFQPPPGVTQLAADDYMAGLGVICAIAEAEAIHRETGASPRWLKGVGFDLEGCADILDDATYTQLATRLSALQTIEMA